MRVIVVLHILLGLKCTNAMKMNLPCTLFVIFLKILITNGGNTNKKVCDRNISKTGEVEYVCPPSPYDSRTSIHVKSTQRLLTIDCNHTEVLDDTVLPRENHSNIVKLKLVRCPFPANGFRDIADRFNITTLMELTFNLANATNYTLKEKELTGLVDLRSMDLSDSNIFSLNGAIFKNTPNLSVLALNGNRIELNEDLLNNLPNLMDFSMNSNNISYIPKNTFDKLSKLKTLELWNNKIRRLESGVFDHLKNLNRLNLSLNEIGSIEKGSFRNLINLVDISLGMNQLKEISRKIFENCSNMETIRIDKNSGVILIDDIFSQFDKLREVNLAHNLLTNIPESLFNGSANLRVIRLNHNKLINLGNNLFNGLQNLEELHLDNNEIENLDRGIFSSLRNLKLLNLQHNKIKGIDEILLRNMKSLVEINLSYNKMESMHSESLINNKYLEKFSMSHNYFNMSFLQMHKLFIHHHISKLKEVDLSYNNLSTYPEVLNQIRTMEKINLTNNLIAEIELTPMLASNGEGDSNLEINLDFNNITSINVNSHDPNISRYVSTIVTITNNPILCDCKAIKLARFLQEDDSLRKYIWFEPNEVRCSGLMEGKILNEIDPADLTCRLDKKCTKNDVCDCFKRSFDDSLIVNCSKRELTDIPELIPSELSKYSQIIVHLEGNRLRRCPGKYDGYKNITELYLQQNEITNVTWIPASLKSVYPDLIVQIRNGKILGQTLSTFNNKSFHAFQGIPFAKPPIGNLRFKPPQQADDWEGILDDRNARKMCIQTSSTQSPNEDEDCLYLNVYTPQLPTNGKNVSLPVMFVVHGGAFLHGSGDIDHFGPQYLMDYDIIVVVIQYRLGFYGFISTEDLICPGNNGFKDQQLALRWVQENIHFFGGNSKEVTIFGESAGAASISYQLLGSNAKGLFRGAIQNSGSSLSIWSLQKNPRSIAYKFANYINSTINETNTSTQELMDFFRTIEVPQVKKASVDLFGENIISNIWNMQQGFGMMGVIEPEHKDAFLTESAYHKFSSGNFNVVPTLLGYNSEETLFLNLDPRFIEKMENYDKHTELFVPYNMNLKDPLVSQKVGSYIRNIYVKDGLLHKHEGLCMKYFSDSGFCRPITKQAKFQSNLTDVYLYEFAYSGIMGSGKPPVEISGAGKVVHGEDMRYLFHKKTAAPLQTYPEDDIINMKRILTLWTNFVKYLNPTPFPEEITQNVIWPKVSSSNKTPNLLIGKKLEIQYNSRKNMLDEYNRLYKQYGVPPLETY